jgi:hypothetical protein
LVGPEQAALTEHGVHQGCFSMVNVGDDGYVSQAVVYRSLHDSKDVLFGSTKIFNITP